MSWAPPQDWDDGNLMGATKLNLDVRNNELALKAPPSYSFVPDEDANYSLAAGAWEAVDADNMSVALATGGGDVFVGFHGTFSCNTLVPLLRIDVAVDGVRIAGDDGIINRKLSTSLHSLSFIRLIPDLAAGEHTFELQWKTNVSGTLLYAGAGTANRDLHPQFWAREMS